MAAILDAIADHWPIAGDAEITLEANPTSVEAENFACYRASGVNRLSLGVQALDDRSLKALGRQHTAERSARGARPRQAPFRPRVIRPDLCARGTDSSGVERRASPRGRPCGRPSLALSAHHRRWHAVRRAPRCRLVAHSRWRARGRALSHHPGAMRGGGLAGLRDLEPRAARLGIAPQPDLLARSRLCGHRCRRA